MTKATEATEKELLDAIRGSGMRLTLARRAIVRVLAESKDDFLTASTILDRLNSTTGQVDASTVYRTLEELSRLGFIHHVHLGNQPGAWHVTINHDHQHLVCEVCGRTTTIPLEELAPTLELIRGRYGFRPNIHHFAILGYCDDCQPPPDHPHGEF